jgi:hypothetical protein
MTNVLDYHVLPEMPFLEELVEDLEGTFHMIAHAGYERDIRFIKGRQKYFRDRYEKYLEHCQSDQAIFHVIPAYYELQELLVLDKSPDRIISDCENALYEHLIRDEDSELNLGPFEDFFKQ